MRNKTAEEAYLEMLKPGENIKIKTQYRIEEFNKIKELPGDGFYIRYLSVAGNENIRQFRVACWPLYERKSTNVVLCFINSKLLIYPS